MFVITNYIFLNQETKRHVILVIEKKIILCYKNIIVLNILVKFFETKKS